MRLASSLPVNPSGDNILDIPITSHRRWVWRDRLALVLLRVCFLGVSICRWRTHLQPRPGSVLEHLPAETERRFSVLLGNVSVSHNPIHDVCCIQNWIIALWMPITHIKVCPEAWSSLARHQNVGIGDAVRKIPIWNKARGRVGQHVRGSDLCEPSRGSAVIFKGDSQRHIVLVNVLQGLKQNPSTLTVDQRFSVDISRRNRFSSLVQIAFHMPGLAQIDNRLRDRGDSDDYSSERHYVVVARRAALFLFSLIGIISAGQRNRLRVCLCVLIACASTGLLWLSIYRATWGWWL